MAAQGTNTSESPSDIPMGLRPAVSTMEKHPCADPTSSQDGKPLLTVTPILQTVSREPGQGSRGGSEFLWLGQLSSAKTGSSLDCSYTQMGSAMPVTSICTNAKVKSLKVFANL